MAIRFAPFARIRVLSLATELLKFPDDPAAAISAFAGAVAGTRANIKLLDPSELFTDIGLATEISITQTFNTRAQYGIGEPANPAIVPGNLSVRVTMSRLTTDSKQMADYITSPTFYYNNIMQRISVAEGIKNFPALIGNLDMLFYTYLHVGSIETANSTINLENRQLELYQNYELIAFMPNSFTKRLSSQNAEVVTDVEGEGKLYKLTDLYEALSGFDDEAVEELTSDIIPQNVSIN